MKLAKRFKRNPSLYYSFSIAATWAGAGSFIVGTQVARESGLFPWLLWALGNTLCCIVFGLVAERFPKLRQVAASRPIQVMMGLTCIFQIWINMNGIHEMLAPTVIGSRAAYWIVYGLSAFFILFYLKRATFRNVATDDFSWVLVYILIAVLVAYSMFANGVHPIPTTIIPSEIKRNAWLCFTLSAGGFFYPTFWELLDYNDGNDEGTSKVDMRGAFARGGLLFGLYLLFVLAGAFTTYSPAADLLKGILVSLIAVSSLSSFIYGAMVNFGKPLGVAIDIGAVALWQVVLPMGALGVWTMLQNVRIWMIIGMFIAAYSWYRHERKAVA